MRVFIAPPPKDYTLYIWYSPNSVLPAKRYETVSWNELLREGFQPDLLGKSKNQYYSGADICKICAELCAFGLKASYLVKMLPFLH